MFRFASRCARVSLVGLALALLPAGLLADTREPADRVTVLNAGTFLILEVHQTKLGDVLNRLAAHLKAELFNTDRLNLERIIDGRQWGSLEEVLRWLVRDGGFIIISEEPKPGDPRPPKLVRIGFLSPGDATPTPSSIASTMVREPVESAHVQPSKESTPPPRTRTTIIGKPTPRGKQTSPSDADIAAGKPVFRAPRRAKS